MVENRSYRMSHSSVAQLPEFSTQPLASSGGGSAGASVAVSWRSAVESDIGKGSGTGSSSLSSEATTKKPRWNDEKCIKMHWDAISQHVHMQILLPFFRSWRRDIWPNPSWAPQQDVGLLPIKPGLRCHPGITIKEQKCWCLNHISCIYIYIYMYIYIYVIRNISI